MMKEILNPENINQLYTLCLLPSTLYLMPFLPATRISYPAPLLILLRIPLGNALLYALFARNPQPATHNLQPVTRIPQPATRNPYPETQCHLLSINISWEWLSSHEKTSL